MTTSGGRLTVGHISKTIIICYVMSGIFLIGLAAVDDSLGIIRRCIALGLGLLLSSTIRFYKKNLPTI